MAGRLEVRQAEMESRKQAKVKPGRISKRE
jgi:hypothetical protein